MIMMIIELKGAILAFTISSSRRELSPTRTLRRPGYNRVQIACNTQSAYHVQHVVCHVVRRDSSAIKFDRVENRIHLSFILLAEPLNRWRRVGNRSTRRKPLATSFRKCHILRPEDSSPKRNPNPHSCIGGRLGKQTHFIVCDRSLWLFRRTHVSAFSNSRVWLLC